jgi:ParB family chromosome partitioning protein
MTTSTETGKRRALGRGLESLLPSRNPAPAPPSAPVERHMDGPASGSAREIPVEQIERNPHQTRSQFDQAKLAELAQSIAATGVVQPIVVRAVKDGRFQLIAGERRWLASKIAGKATIPAVIRDASDEQSMEMTIVENLQRADLNPMEQARAYERLGREFRMTQEQMAQRTGKERASVSNFLRLLKLPQDVQNYVESGELTYGHARTLLALDSPEAIIAAANKVRNLSLSVRQTEGLVNAQLNPERDAKPDKVIEPLDPNVREARDQLQRALGLRVRIQDRKGKGRVIIEYSTVSDFDRIVDALDNK